MLYRSVYPYREVPLRSSLWILRKLSHVLLRHTLPPLPPGKVLSRHVLELQESSPDYINEEDFEKRLDFYREAYETVEVGAPILLKHTAPVCTYRRIAGFWRAKRFGCRVYRRLFRRIYTPVFSWQEDTFKV